MLADPGSVGATLERTDRGGDVTYHGPGQLVAYPIVTVPDDLSSGAAHVHRLEELVIETLADLGLPGARPADGVPRRVGRRGGGATPARSPPSACARRGGAGRRRTLHGVALNVTTDLAMFDHIVPCGIAGRGVTSLAAEGIDVAMDDVIDAAGGACDRHVRPTGRPNAPTSSPGPGPTLRVVGDEAERPLLRRLRQAGVAPEDGLDIAQRKPEWVRVPVRIGKGYRQLGATVHDLGLVTVCEEAGCPTSTSAGPTARRRS